MRLSATLAIAAERLIPWQWVYYPLAHRACVTAAEATASGIASPAAFRTEEWAGLRSSRGGPMARTSNRRWKGCPMCKPHKIAGNGDAERMPYSARKAFPSRKGKGISRHDAGQWGHE